MHLSHTNRRRLLKMILPAGMALALFAHGMNATAQTRITYKSAKTGSSYYQMAVEISQAMHFVTRADAGIKSFADLAGKTMLVGKGSFGANEGQTYLKLFGLEGKVKLANVELNNAVPALKNGQIDGFVTAGSYPAPNVIEAAAATGVHILSLSDGQVKQTKRTRFVIPAGTYAGQKEDVVTTSLPVIAYTTTQMDDETAYQLTRAYWTERAKMAATAPWWGGVNERMLANIEGKIHPGALRYYKEVDYPVTDANR